MITAWQTASLPLWFVGFYFCYVALIISTGFKKKDEDTKTDLMGQCAVGFCFGMPCLALAAFMWGH